MIRSREEDFKDIMHFQYTCTANMATPSTRTIGPGVMKFTMLVDPSLVINDIYTVCPIYA